ncbi:hypothetical protein [Agromyces humi]|uniref:hypothetical protein n=1 Tax=Agromyces humi TaxID=1766800 RepID=UPI00135BDC22|nr:hypothetical protein [Agromyces humi]
MALHAHRTRIAYPDGSFLEGATNVRVPAVGHFRVLGAHETHTAVLDGVALLAQG